MYALVDCNTFYASCETIFRPDLVGKPVLVLSNNDGCIISRNKEAKALNIPDLAPYFQVREMVERLQCQVFSSNYELYGDISARVMQLLDTMATEMEVYSIDEAFLRIHCKDFKAHGIAIKQMLQQQVGMPVCVGIAPTKTLAKLANKFAKKNSKVQGVCVLDTAARRDWLLQRVQTKDIWGVGERVSERLKLMGIHTAAQLAQADRKTLRRNFSVVLERTIRELNGEPCLDLELQPAPKKEIVCTRSFSYKITELHELQQAICLYAERACEKLRAQNSMTGDIWVYLESFDQQVGYFNRQRVVRLPFLSNDTRLISRLASDALVPIFQQGLRYKKCGIGLLDVRPRKFEQSDFFNPVQTDTAFNLMAVMDRVNRRYGKHTMKLAGSGIQPEWSMKRDFISPRYTTRWTEIPTIRC